MKIVVLGLGVVGYSTAAWGYYRGHDVVGIDIVPERRREAEEKIGDAHFPGRDFVAGGRFQTAETFHQEEPDLTFVCVGTPMGTGGEIDLSQIEGVSRDLQCQWSTGALVNRCTVLPGTTERIFGWVTEMGQPLLYCPEFLRERTPLTDYAIFLNVVGGTNSDALEIYLHTLDTYHTDIQTAELAKYMLNAFHALKVAYINEMWRLAHRLLGDAWAIADVLKQDPLSVSGYYMTPGNPFGGRCLPKDMNALLQAGLLEEGGVLEAILTSNAQHADFWERMPEMLDGCE